MSRLWAHMRDARYALPGWIERSFDGPDAVAAGALCVGYERRGLRTTLGYFQARDATAHQIIAANIAACSATFKSEAARYLSIKAPPLGFDIDAIESIAAAAHQAGIGLVFDAHAPKDTDPTLAIVAHLLKTYPGTGFALPARWQRSLADAQYFRESSARIRVVKGEWADPVADCVNQASAYLSLIESLAGRQGIVAVATHDPVLAEEALTILMKGGTPCELEQLRGLPCRRTVAVALRFAVPVRVYVPFGPGWWPYAVNQALARPYLAQWWFKDRLGWFKDRLGRA